MNRFHKSRGRLRYLRVLLPALLFCVMLLLLLEGLSSVSSAAAREEALSCGKLCSRTQSSAMRWRAFIRKI